MKATGRQLPERVVAGDVTLPIRHVRNNSQQT